MKVTKASLESIESVHTKFLEENNKVYKNVDLLQKELELIDNIVSTPKSTLIIPEFVTGLKEYEQLIQENNETFDVYFKSISKEYNAFLSDLKKKVGGNND